MVCVEESRQRVDPCHGPMKGVGATSGDYRTNAVLQVVLAMPRAFGLDEGFVESDTRQSELLCPEFASRSLVVVVVEVELQNELGIAAEVRPDPRKEEPRRSRIAVR